MISPFQIDCFLSVSSTEVIYYIAFSISLRYYQYQFIIVFVVMNDALSSILFPWHVCWHWHCIPLQVQVNSTDPNLSLGVVHLLAKDTPDKNSGTIYHLIQNGQGFKRSTVKIEERSKIVSDFGKLKLTIYLNMPFINKLFLHGLSNLNKLFADIYKLGWIFRLKHIIL